MVRGEGKQCKDRFVISKKSSNTAKVKKLNDGKSTRGLPDTVT